AKKKNWVEKWKQVVWSDELRFTLFQLDSQARVLKSHEEAYNEYCIQSTIMFWGCFGWHEVKPLVVMEGNIDSDKYVNILANQFIQ
ncbi:13391_t:CDS:1, partial [Funneliformis geosporum]